MPKGLPNLPTDALVAQHFAIEIGGVEIGVAPVKPAEFVIFRIAQYSGGAAVSE